MVSGTIGENHLFDYFVAGKMLAAKIKGIEKKAFCFSFGQMKCNSKSGYCRAKRWILGVFNLGKSLFGDISRIISFGILHPFFCDKIAQIVTEI